MKNFTITKCFKSLAFAAIMALGMSSWAQVSGNSIGLVGSGCTRSWSSSWGIPMVQSVDDSNVFTLTCTLIEGGEIKFHSDRSGTWQDNFWFFAPAPNTDIATALTGQTYLTDIHDAIDNKWVVGPGEGGLYKITVNILETTVKIEPTAPIAAIVGSATSIGWDFHGLPFTPTVDPNILTWTGDLIAGEFKINLTTGEWGDDYWFMAPAAGTSIIGLTNAPADKLIGGNPGDNKWAVNPGDEGNYTVTVNLTDSTITVVDSATLGLHNTTKEAVAIYPNPVANTLFFNSAEVKETNVSVYSMLGNSVIKQKVGNDTSIDVSSLKSGVYVAVFEQDGVKTTKQFVKE